MAEKEDFEPLLKQVHRLLNISYALIGITIVGMVYNATNPELFDLTTQPEPIVDEVIEVDPNRIENGIHLRTGLIDAEGMFLVVSNCTNCHSAKIVTQNRMTTERWNETIKWMQETQGLWDLGESQEIIVNYLVTNYPPKKSGGRRPQLADIDWYELEE